MTLMNLRSPIFEVANHKKTNVLKEKRITFLLGKYTFSEENINSTNIVLPKYF